MDISILLIIVLSLIVFIFIRCNHDSKNNLINTQNDFITGMWANDNKETYLYIDKNSKKNIHKGYIVRENFANEPIKVKIDNNGKNKIVLNIKGTDCVKKINNAKINMTNGTMTIHDKDNSELVLKKE